MTTLTAEELDARVAKGAALLDEQYPGWFMSTDRARLDISSTCNCIAVQVVWGTTDDDDAYEDALSELGVLLGTDAVAHGFSLSGVEAEERRLALGLSTTDRAEIYAPLTDAWQRLIAARLDGAA